MDVVCNKAQIRCLEWCLHSEEHEPEIHSEHGSCTKWGICVPDFKNDTEDIKVRCTKVKKEN